MLTRVGRTFKAEFSLLGRNPAVRRLGLARLASELGGWAASVALAVWVLDRTGSALWVAAVMAARIGPGAITALLTGPLVDRMSRKRLLIVADVLEGIAFVALVFGGPMWWVVVLVAFTGLVGGLFRPAYYASLPNMVEEDDLGRANGLLTAAENLALTVGPLVGGLLLALSGVGTVFAVNAASFVVSALLVRGIPESRFQVAAKGPRRGHWREVGAGLAAVASSPRLRTVFIAWGVVVIPLAGFNVAEVALAKGPLEAGSTGFALMVAATGIGQILGNLVAAGALRRLGLQHAWALGLIGLGIAICCVGASPILAAAVVASALVGLTNGVALVANIQLIQKSALDEFRGRVFSALGGVMSITAVVGMFVSGAVVEALGPRAALAAFGVGVVAIAALAWRVLPALPSAAPASEPAT